MAKFKTAPYALEGRPLAGRAFFLQKPGDWLLSCSSFNSSFCGSAGLLLLQLLEWGEWERTTERGFWVELSSGLGEKQAKSASLCKARFGAFVS